MMTSWAAWRPFPNPQSGGHIDAPIGPGVYEVRHTLTGAVVAFGPSGNVAQDLAILLPKPRAKLWSSLVPRRNELRSEQLEYRTCTATTAQEARTIAERLRGRREVFWRRHLATG